MRRQTAENPAEKKHPFLEAFLFTENGRPKSSLGIYTFCLSFVFLLVYVLCYEGVIRLLTGPLSGLPPFWSNLIIALLAAGLAVSWLLYRRDWRPEAPAETEPEWKKYVKTR